MVIVYQFAITLTLHPRCYKLLPRNQYRQAVRELNNILSNNEQIAFDFIEPELTKSSNIHFHGVINYTSDGLKKAFCMMRIYDLYRRSNIIGIIYLKEIEDYPGWKDYCYKANLNNETKEVIDYIKKNYFMRIATIDDIPVDVPPIETAGPSLVSQPHLDI